MFSAKRLALPISLFTILISLALIVPVALTSQGSAESSTVQYTTTPPDPSLPLPVKEFEVDRHYNYHIPSDEEVATTKQKLMKEDKFKEKAKKVGQQQAEKELDTRIKADIDYMKEKNKLGSEKMPMLEIGEHSAYVSKYTYSVTDDGQCKADIEDPVNVFFYDTGYTEKVVNNLYSAGWGHTDWGDGQCAYTSSTSPGPNGIGDLRLQTIMVDRGYGWLGYLWERDHMRMWEGGLGTGAEGRWSIGAVHHEKTDIWETTHCLIPYEPDGSSFDLAEWHVWYEGLGYYPRFFFNAQNKFRPDGSSWNTCGNTVNHDGYSVGVHITSNTLGPGEFLASGMARYSPDGRFTFTYQTDGNLVLYQAGVGAIWHINRYNYPAAYAVLWADGNLAVYTSGWYPMWYSNTYGSPVLGLFVQNDGNVVIYTSNWRPIWATNTCCR